VIVNALVSCEEEIRSLVRVLREANNGFKCIYLGPDGCLWHLKPIVCEMFSVYLPIDSKEFDPGYLNAG